MSDKKTLDLSILEKLVPLNGLSVQHQSEIASQTSLKIAKAERKVFKRGQVDNYRIYLVQGMVALEYENEPPKLLKGGTEEAMYPLDYYQPHKATAITKTPAAFVVFKDELVERYLALNQSIGFEVDEIDDEQSDDSDDWMMRMLGTKTFSRIPPSNIQTMFIRLESITAEAGEDVINEGEDGDHFYIISKGRCEVLKYDDDLKKQVKVAELGVGDSFGEEALLASTKRNATIRMISDGALMRLKRDDFEELLKEPIIQSVNYDEAVSLAQEGHILLDVRMQAEHKNDGIEGSINVPLNMLRKNVDKLDENTTYIVYCDTGARSSAAVFLLNEQGIAAKILQGGLRSQDAA